MKFFRGNNLRLLVWLAVVVLIIAGLFWVHQAEQRETDRLYPEKRRIRLEQEKWESSASTRWEAPSKNLREGSPPQTNLWKGFSTRAADMTADEKADLEKTFNEKFRPAVEKWFSAYENRIPFKSEDVTLDKFHSTLGNHMFSFMIGDMTLTLVAPSESNQPAKVGYLMSRKAALDMNKLPDKGFVPNVNVAVTREDIIRMVKADSGVEFKPNEVMIKPTALSCALNGGAFVDLLPMGADPNNFLNYKISMVFGPDGKLVNYERDPRF